MKTKTLTHTLLLISIAALTPAALAQNSASDKTGRIDRNDPTDSTPDRTTDRTTDRTATGERATAQSGSLTSVLADSATFSTLTKAIKAAGLDATLGSTDEFTIFAPTDEAFGKLPTGTLDKLMLPENKEKLRMLLLYHVVAGKVMAADLTDGDVKTANGEKLDIDVSDDKVEVNGAQVFSADVSATNGVLHSIGEVLVPKSLDEFADLED